MQNDYGPRKRSTHRESSRTQPDSWAKYFSRNSDVVVLSSVGLDLIAEESGARCDRAAIEANLMLPKNREELVVGDVVTIAQGEYPNCRHAPMSYSFARIGEQFPIRL